MNKLELKIILKAGKESVTLQDLDFNLFETTFRNEAQFILREYAPKIVERAKIILISRYKPKWVWRRTRRLERSIRWRTTAKGIRIYASAPYALFVEKPTKPHLIKARKRKWLRWTDALGNQYFAKQVWHTGTEGKYFMRDAINQYRLAIDNKLKKALVKALNESAKR